MSSVRWLGRFCLERHGVGLSLEGVRPDVDVGDGGRRQQPVGVTNAAGRLLVASGHRRARRFYEREGWQVTGHVETSGELGLELAEYVLELPD